MEQAFLIINRGLPILLLISLGFWIQQKNFLAPKTVDEIRKIVVNLALPAVIFISFLSIELKSSYLILFIILFLLCVLLFLFGRMIGKLLNVQYTYFPYLITGFEYGMLAVSLFGAAYGLENIGYIAVVDLGHEIFIWFVFLPLLLIKRDGVQEPKEIIRSFLSSPVVIAIIASLVLNIFGLNAYLYVLPITGGLMATLDLLSKLTIPLILIIVGYGVEIDREGLQEALVVSGLRLGIMIPAALVLNSFLIRNLLNLGKPFEVALFTLLIMPPPFIVPLFSAEDTGSDEKRYINNVLTIHTLISVTLFLVYFIFNPLG